MNILRISKDSLRANLEPGEQIFVVEVNSAGKSLANKKALEILKDVDMAEQMSTLHCEGLDRNLMLSQVSNGKSITSNVDSIVILCITSPYSKELICFKKLVSDQNLDNLFVRYSVRKSAL